MSENMENKDMEIKDMKVISEDELGGITGGANGWVGLYHGPWKKVKHLKSGWLALRSAPFYDYSNEIGQLYNGDSVQITGNSSGDGYIWVYAKKLNKSGWVNERYIG